jgi:hypothetical protein
MKASGNTQTPLPSQQADIPLPNWYRSIVELPLNKFMDVQVDNNLAALTISGFPSPNDLTTAWNDIQQEFADAIGTAQHKMRLAVLKEIMQLKVKLAVITDMVDLMRQVYYKPFADRLNKLLFTKYAFDYTNLEQYNKELTACINRSKSIKINIDLKELSLEAKKPKEGEGEVIVKNTRERYLSDLIILSDHAGYQIHAEDIFTYEYTIRMNRWNKHCEDTAKLNKKK